MTDDSSQKEFDPTERKLAEARRKGEIPIGRDLVGAAAGAGFLVALWLMPGGVLALGQTGAVLLEQADTLAGQMVSGHAGLLAGLLGTVVQSVAVYFALPVVAILVMLIAQRGLVVSGERLRPRLSRISPLAGARQKFGPDGLFEFAKNLVKLSAISAVLAWFLMGRAPLMFAAMQADPRQVALVLGQLILAFLFLVVLLQGIIGVADLVWQQASHIRRNRMTRREMMDEMRQSEGDPQLKAQRRRKAEAIATNRMMLDVPKADVVIVNPTHYAVALRWDRTARGAPVCVAKGVDEVAARIREEAMRSGVPVRRDPPTARAIHASVAIGEPVRPEHYRAVAAAIRFSDALRRRQRARHPHPAGDQR